MYGVSHSASRTAHAWAAQRVGSRYRGPLDTYPNMCSYSIRMDTFVASEKQRMGAFAVVVGSLVSGSPADEVEALAEAVGPLSCVGFAEQVERHEVEQLGEPVEIGEGPHSVTDPALYLAQNPLDRSSRAQ